MNVNESPTAPTVEKMTLRGLVKPSGETYLLQDDIVDLIKKFAKGHSPEVAAAFNSLAASIAIGKAYTIPKKDSGVGLLLDLV